MIQRAQALAALLAFLWPGTEVIGIEPRDGAHR